tara:strand:- start:552 stop:1502 length:951 start_codon:yes stop_codon:yes gene_type:complete
MSIDKFNNLKSKWKKFQQDNPKVRIRDAAYQMKVSEAELLSTEINETVSFLLIEDMTAFIKDVLKVDKIMLLIRSDYVVHEKTIKTKNITLEDNQIIDLDKNDCSILDFNIDAFEYVFFQKKMHSNRELKSFQFFDKAGMAILKIYLKGKDLGFFDEIDLKYKKTYNYEMQSDLDINNSNLLDSKIKINLPYDTSNSKTSCRDISVKSLRLILENASDMKTPIQIHALGLGTIQYHRNTVRNIVDYGPWVNVIDQKFNLHVLENGLTRASLIQYQFKDCQQYLINFFDKNNTHVLGVTNVKGFDKDFLKIINNIKE